MVAGKTVDCPKCYARAGEACRDLRKLGRMISRLRETHAERRIEAGRVKPPRPVHSPNGIRIPESKMASNLCESCGVRYLPHREDVGRCYTCTHKEER